METKIILTDDELAAVTGGDGFASDEEKYAFLKEQLSLLVDDYNNRQGEFLYNSPYNAVEVAIIMQDMEQDWAEGKTYEDVKVSTLQKLAGADPKIASVLLHIASTLP